LEISGSLYFDFATIAGALVALFVALLFCAFYQIYSFLDFKFMRVANWTIKHKWIKGSEAKEANTKWSSHLVFASFGFGKSAGSCNYLWINIDKIQD
jgi:hypothetical protein